MWQKDGVRLIRLHGALAAACRQLHMFGATQHSDLCGFQVYCYRETKLAVLEAL